MQYSIISILWFNIFRVTTYCSMYTMTDKLINLLPKTSDLYTTRITQSGNKASNLSELKKHSKDSLKHFPSIVKTYEELINKINMH